MEKSSLWESSEEHLVQPPVEHRLSRALASQDLDISSKGEANTSLGSLFQYSHKNFFTYPVKILLEETFFHCLLSCHCVTLWREYLYFLCNYVAGTGRLWLYPMSFLFLRVNKESSFNISSYARFFLITLAAFHFINISPELRGAKLDKIFLVWPHERQGGWNKHIPWPAGCFGDAAQDMVCLHGWEDTLPACG